MKKTYLCIWIGVSLLVAIGSGFFLSREPTREGTGDHKDNMMWAVFLWPLAVVIGVLWSPYWLPIFLRNVVWWVRDHWHKRQAIKALMSSVRRKANE